MNKKELSIIQATADGIARARTELSGPDGFDHMASAICDLYEHLDRPLRSADAGYYAAMLLAWKDQGCPDCFS